MGTKNWSVYRKQKAFECQRRNVAFRSPVRAEEQKDETTEILNRLNQIEQLKGFAQGSQKKVLLSEEKRLKKRLSLIQPQNSPSPP